MRGRRLTIILSAALAAAVLAACGENTIVADEAEKSVTDVVQREGGFEPTDVSCPDGVEAKVGDSFECTFTGPDGDYIAELEMTKVEDELVVFDITSRPDR